MSLSGARDPGPLDGRRLRGKESTSSGGRGGGLGDRGGATPRIVELVEIEGRSKSSVAECWEREGGGAARAGPGNAPGRASSAGLVGRTRVRARHERCLSRAPDRSNPLPSLAFVSYSGRLLGRQSSSPEGKRKGARDPGGALQSSVGGRTAAAVTGRGWRRRRYPILPYLPACF